MYNKYRCGQMCRLNRALCLLFLLAQALTVSLVAQKPNIVFIMADDLGAGWVDFDGSNAKLNTPNLERLADTGMVFTQAYSAATVCSPTRAACITGMSPAQIGLTTHIPGKAHAQRPAPKGGPKDADSLYHLPLELPSYARELKKQGYATGFIGKWHLAGTGSVQSKNGTVDSRYHPEHFGFDINIGGNATGQPKSWFDPYRNDTIKNRKPGEYLTDRLGDEAVSFIEANTSAGLVQGKDQPFHLSLWFYQVHTPIRAPKDLVKKNGGDQYNAMIESMDMAIGKVLDVLEATGTFDNTMIVFYSDNGGWKATPWLHDKKGSMYEGGIRVPMAVSWPKVIKGGSSTDVPVNSMDFFPTFVHAAGGRTDDIAQLEGEDLMPLFKGADSLGRDTLYWHYPHNRPDVKLFMGSVILEGDWKLYEGYSVMPDALYNLKDDPMEKNNLLSSNPELADRLRKKLHRWLSDVEAKMPPSVKLSMN